MVLHSSSGRRTKGRHSPWAVLRREGGISDSILQKFTRECIGYTAWKAGIQSWYVSIEMSSNSDKVDTEYERFGYVTVTSDTADVSFPWHRQQLTSSTILTMFIK